MSMPSNTSLSRFFSSPVFFTRERLVASPGDLGKTPITLFCLRQSLLFFHRLCSMGNHRLAAKAFNESVGLQRDDKHSWMSSLRCLAKQVNLELDICRTRNMKASTFKNVITRKLNSAFNAYWSRAITSTVGRSKKGSNKLQSYQSFKTRIQMEPYYLLSDRELRRAVAKFRCSDHSLRIETGRRENITPDERKCLVCTSSCVENEQHFLVDCQEYSDIRKEFFNMVQQEVPLFNRMDSTCKFIYLLSCENSKVGKGLAKYLKKAFEIRTDTLLRSTSKDNKSTMKYVIEILD